MSTPHFAGRIRLTRRTLALALTVLISHCAYAGTTVVSYTYDAADRVTSVTDPRGLITSYAYDGFGQLWQQTSPDTGSTTYSYDGNGRRSSMTRANGVQTAYSYDTVGRIAGLSAGGQSQSFTYDTCANGIGRLCAAADANGSVGYSYTPEGWISGRAFTVGSTSYTIGYGYNAMGQVAAVVYPDGNQALYSYTNGVVSSVSLNVGGTTITGASQITYQPQDKAMTGWISSNGLSTTLSYDSDGRLTGVNVPNVQSLSLSYDNANRIVQLTNGVIPGLTQSFGYDDQSRLVSVYGDMDNEAYQYDASGNRIAQTVNGASKSISYDSASNRMTGFGTTSFGYDAQGNSVTQNGASQWQYNSFNRLAASGENTYYVDPQGQRLIKVVGGTSTYFAPEENNNLVAENDSGTWVDYVWLNARLIGRVSAGQVQVVHLDQVGRPEAVTNASQAVVWRAQNMPFTRTVTASNGVTLNIGFPGQYYDTELTLWNNGTRDYADWVGRYIESDYAGLAGGINTYTYVGDSPLLYVDPSGLNWGDAITMTYEWATGTGPDHRDFGPNSSEAAEMADAPGVLAAEALYRKKNALQIKNHCPASSFEPVTNYAAHFGLTGLVESGLNPTEQFIGSYRVDVYPTEDGQMNVVINNTSSFRSFAYGVAPDWNRSTFGPMGNMSQTINITAKVR